MGSLILSYQLNYKIDTGKIGRQNFSKFPAVV